MVHQIVIAGFQVAVQKQSDRGSCCAYLAIDNQLPDPSIGFVLQLCPQANWPDRYIAWNGLLLTRA